MAGFLSGGELRSTSTANPIGNLGKEEFLKLWKEREFCIDCGYLYSGCIIPQTGKQCPIYSRLIELGVNPVEEWVKNGICEGCNLKDEGCKVNGKYCVVYEWKRNNGNSDSKKDVTNQNSTIATSQGGCQEVAKDNKNVTVDIVNQSDENSSSIQETEQNKAFSGSESSTLEQTINQSKPSESSNNGKKRRKVKDSIEVNKQLTHRLTNGQLYGEKPPQQLPNRLPKGQTTLDPFEFKDKLDETDIRILRLINNGFCQTNIAKILRCSQPAIHKRIKKLLKFGFIVEVKDDFIIDRRVKKYKLTIPNIAEITSQKVNHESRGIDSRVEWGYFRLHGFQRRYSLLTGLQNQLLVNIDALRKVRGFKYVGKRPNWRFVVIERDGFKWEIRPRSIGVSISEDCEFYWIPFKNYNWKRSLKDKLRREIDEKTEKLIEEIEQKTGVKLEYKPDGWSHEPELAFLDGDGVIRKIAEEYGKIYIEGLGRIDASTGEPELEFEGNEERDACETGESFKDALMSVGKLANGELPEPLKESIKETVIEATVLGGSRTIQHQINELFSLVVKVMQRQDAMTEKFLEALNNIVNGNGNKKG